MLNLDTHIAIDMLRGQLRPDELRLIDREGWGISDIVIWEIFSLVNQQRLAMDINDPDFNEDLRTARRWPVSVGVCRQLQHLDFRSDPADEIIAATSIHHRVPLLTRDTKLLASKVVPLAFA